MKLSVNFGCETLVIPFAAVNSGASDFDLAVLLRLCSQFRGKSFGDIRSLASELAESAGKSSAEVEASLHFWRGTKIISFDTAETGETSTPAAVKTTPNTVNLPSATVNAPPDKDKKVPLPDSRPEYSGEEASRIIERTNGMKRLIDECQRSLGKIFTQSDINCIVRMSDNLGLSNEHILMLVLYCKSRGKTAMHYIEKTAYGLYDDEGIDSLAAFEEYIKSHEHYGDNVRILRDLFGFGDRTLTPRENKLFETWLTKWRVPCDMIRRAYEITVDSTDNHKLSLPYLNKVLSNWHDAGYKTLEEVDAALEQYKKDRENQSENNSGSAASFDTDEFFELALKRSYEKLGENKN